MNNCYHIKWLWLYQTATPGSFHRTCKLTFNCLTFSQEIISSNRILGKAAFDHNWRRIILFNIFISFQAWKNVLDIHLGLDKDGGILLNLNLWNPRSWCVRMVDFVEFQLDEILPFHKFSVFVTQKAIVYIVSYLPCAIYTPSKSCSVCPCLI